MAYTYDDFVSAATKANLLDRFSQTDLTTAQKNPEYGLSLLSLTQDAANASTAEQRLLATEAANQLRKNYGVYGIGDDAAGYSYASSYGSNITDLMDKINNYGSFDYANQNAYQKLLDQVANHGSFSYDLESDPSWSAYKKAYLREGDRATANTLAQASAASGGLPSSYAMTAAQQASNYYAGQLGDMIPTLEQTAYQKYLDDFSNKLSSLSALQSDRAFDYEDYLNQYNMLQNSLGNYQNQDATDYARYLDQYQQAYQAEQDKLAQEYQAQQDAIAAEQQKYANALALYQTMGYATPEVAAILGIPSGSAIGYSGGYSGGSGASGTSGSTSGETTDNLESTATGIPESYITALRNAYPTGEIKDGEIWNKWVAQYGEDAMNAAGFSYLPSDNAGSMSAKSSTSNNGSNSLRVDMQSVLALGYGPINESKLNQLVEQGEIEEYVENGYIKFRKVAKPSTSTLYNFAN